MEEEDRTRISKSLREDQNYIAYQNALKAGEFKDLEPGTYVIFHQGQLVGTGTDREKLFEELNEKGIFGFLFHQVNVPERVYHMRSPRRIK